MADKPKTFAIPLKKKGTGALDSMFNEKGDAAVGKRIRELSGDSWYPISPPLKPNVGCSYCPAEYNPNTKTWGSGCNGQCVQD